MGLAVLYLQAFRFVLRKQNSIKSLTDFGRLPDVEVHFGNEGGSVNREILR